VIHSAQQKGGQIANIAWNQEGKNLSPAIAQQLISASKPVTDEANVFWPTPIRGNVLADADLPRPDGRSHYDLPFSFGEPNEVFELTDERFGH
jgi:hypothetical protein